MGRPAKPFSVITSEKKSHRTKAELEARKKAEESLMTGIALREREEVKNNERAHKEFMKINRALKKINKNDALFEGVINRYCILAAECEDFEKKRSEYHERYLKFIDMENKIDEMGMTPLEYYKMLGTFQSNVSSIDKQIHAKRKMMMDIEKENLMTIQGGLRSIPKKETTDDDPLKELLRNG